MVKYTIKKPIITDGEIVGYEVIDNNGNTKRAKLEDVFQLIEKGLTNCEIVLDDKNEKHILFKEDRPDISFKSDEEIHYTIECRLIQNGSLVGYKCKDSTGTSKRINPSRVWELAACNNITNARAKIVNNQITLEGKNTRLADLAVLVI